MELPGKPIYHKQIYKELEVFWERVLVVSGAVDVNELKSLDPKSGENGDASPTQARRSAPLEAAGGLVKFMGGNLRATGPNAKHQGVKAFLQFINKLFTNIVPE